MSYITVSTKAGHLRCHIEKEATALGHRHKIKHWATVLNHAAEYYQLAQKDVQGYIKFKKSKQ